MNIKLKGKYLYYLKYKIKCSIGKEGITRNKKEGDLKTPKGKFKLKLIFYRKDKIKILKTSLKKIAIQKNMGWCDDATNKKKYNKLIKVNKNIKHEKLYRIDNEYDLLIPIKYNFYNTVLGKGSCIFIHLTKDYKPTAGCIALRKKDFLIMLKILKKNTKIVIP